MSNPVDEFAEFAEYERAYVARYLDTHPDAASNQRVKRVLSLIDMLVDCNKQRLQWKASAERCREERLSSDHVDHLLEFHSHCMAAGIHKRLTLPSAN